MAEKKKVGTDRSGAEKPPFYKSLKGNEQAFGDAAKRFHRTKAGATPTEANRFSNMEDAMQKR